MITTVTLNAAIDKTYVLSDFQLGKVSRIGQIHAVAGGKGINAARVLHQLGIRTLATGFVGGSNGDFILKNLDQQQISHDFVKVDDESRICLNIMNASNGESTELLEKGPLITEQQLAEFRQKIVLLGQQSRIVIFSGSIPAGLSTSVYAELIEALRKTNAAVFLDTSGDGLIHGLKAAPFFMKPNEDEIAQLTGKRPENETELVQSLHQLADSGIECASVSLGASGSMTVYKGTIYRVRVPSIEALNPVGSGDAYVAGMAAGIYQELPIEDCLRLAAACGTANALSAHAGFVKREDVDAFLKQIEIVQL
ncbi:1-phosphofructokinase [Paenibacillus eucommiae]|uniref:Tagatose-6-phosphate kinase n=1 Tax=Paenibacillus eucommiae TaxID=1355755 RepID=A0ABS4J0R9_9BACL|nr:1-phosphofructokinase [Paenibacillus eucommiae]MBP1993390.1 tagatose 6-phosphate kinase [Paenibacillus eucommiae]